jgi:energy-coupling factor transporter ATP-binding protein EcfA2
MIPSRHSNPFATCWTRPGAIAFQFANGENAETLIDRLAHHEWQGAIVGPHGSGKTTLLNSLAPLLVHADRPVRVVDGYEQLGWPARARLRLCRRASKAGLLVTSHRRTILPTVIELSPGLELTQQIVAQLSAQIPTPVTSADVAASYARHGSNVREILFDLYDRHERLSRPARTAVGTHA